MDMVEKVARALCKVGVIKEMERCNIPATKPEFMTAAVDREWDLYQDDARAAIKAMRDPTDAMRLAIPPRFGEMTYRDIGDIWRAMVDYVTINDRSSR